MNRDYFSSLHPIVNMLYFICVIGFALAFDHPICLGISFIGAYSYLLCLKGVESIKQNMKYMLPLIILTAVINPAFSHQGITILTYLPTGNPLTLESIYYGISAAFLLATVITWFSCFNQIFTSDKLIYILGRFAPTLSLMLSMTLKFIPDCRAQYQAVYKARKGARLGGDESPGIISRMMNGIHIMSAVVTWALERAVTTSDSMRARCYGGKGRKAYAIYEIKKRDIRCLILLSAAGAYVLAGGIRHIFYFQYYPFLQGVKWGLYEYGVVFVYVLLVFGPVILHGMEEMKWKYIQSKI